MADYAIATQHSGRVIVADADQVIQESCDTVFSPRFVTANLYTI